MLCRMTGKGEIFPLLPQSCALCSAHTCRSLSHAGHVGLMGPPQLRRHHLRRGGHHCMLAPQAACNTPTQYAVDSMQHYICCELDTLPGEAWRRRCAAQRPLVCKASSQPHCNIIARGRACKETMTDHGLDSGRTRVARAGQTAPAPPPAAQLGEAGGAAAPSLLQVHRHIRARDRTRASPQPTSARGCTVAWVGKRNTIREPDSGWDRGRRPADSDMTCRPVLHDMAAPCRYVPRVSDPPLTEIRLFSIDPSFSYLFNMRV